MPRMTQSRNRNWATDKERASTEKARKSKKEIRRTGQQKASGLAVAVDGALDGVQQLRFALDLVQRYGCGTPDEHLRVAARDIEGIEIVKRGIASPA